MNENHNNFNESVSENMPSAKGNKKALIAILISAVLVITLGAVAVSALFASPLALVGTGIANSAKALEKNEMVTLLEKYAKGGSMQIDIGLEGILNSLLGLDIDSTATFKIYSGGEDGAAVTADVTVRDRLFLDAAIIASKTAVTVTSQKLLDGAVYGIDLENAPENFDGSVFGPTGPFSIGLESLEEITDNIAQSEAMKKELQKIEEDLLGIVFDSLSENAAVGKEKKDLDFNGEKVKMTAVSVKLSSEATANVFADLIEYLYTNEDLEQFLRSYDTFIANYLSGLDIVPYYGDSDDFVDDLYDYLEEIYTELDDYKEKIVDSGVELSIVFYVTKSDKELVGVDFAFEVDGEEASVSVLAGPALSDLREVKVKIDDGWSVIRVGYTVDVNDKTEYVAELEVREDDMVLASGEISWDKKSGAYEISVGNSYDETVAIEGKFEYSAQSATLTVEKLSSYYEDVDLALSIQINASDKMPAMPQNYTEVLTMSQYELEDLTADMAAALMNEVYSLDLDVLNALQYLMWYFI